MSEQLRFPVITIGRQYGAYGRTVAAALSKKLEIPYYDKDFVRETVKKSGYSLEEVERSGEDLSPASKLMNSILNNAVVYNSSHDQIFKAEKEVVLELAKSPCIIVGRCADAILREAKMPALHVFLYADKEVRIKRASELAENEGLDPKKVVAKRDTMRETYYKQYSKTTMGDYKNYHICLDTGLIGPDKCVEILEGIIKK